MTSAYLVHQAGERVRLRLPGKRGDQAFFTELLHSLRSCDAVAEVRVNPLTASVLLSVRPDHDLETIERFASERGHFQLQTNTPLPQKTVREHFADQVNEVDLLLRSSTQGRLDTQSLFMLLFFALGLRQVAQGVVMQPAIPLLWRAWGLIGRVKPPP